MNFNNALFMHSIFTLYNALTDARSVATTLHTSLSYLKAFQWGTGYCMTLYLKAYQNHNRSKLKFQFLLSKFWLLNFDLSHFWYHLRYRVIQYPIEKLLDMVKMGQEGLVVAALLESVRTSWKVTIYYINSALLILKWKPLCMYYNVHC